MKNHVGVLNSTLIANVGSHKINCLVASIMFSSMVMASGSAPTKPHGVHVKATEGALLLQWSNSYDADGAVVGYEMARNGTVHWLGNVNSYHDTAVSQGVTYAYNLMAVDDQGNRSAMSDTVTYRFLTQNNQSSSGGTSVSGGSISTGSAAACVDTDGDGWGWDGKKSCKVTTSSSNGASGGNACVDEDGDGYGWNGYQTCFVTSNGSTANQCIDSDGDGYGWDGSKTCIP